MKNSNASKFNDPLHLVQKICTVDQLCFGLDYLQHVCINISNVLDCKYVLISRPVSDKPGVVITEVAVNSGQVGDNIEYCLVGSPCENVFSGDRVCFHPDDVAVEFPDDLLLQDIGVRSYIGAPIVGPSGELYGILVLLDDKPATHIEFLMPIIEFIASRVGVEIEKDIYLVKLREQEREAFHRQRLESLGQLANGVAHDFNNLLAGVLGHVELLNLKLGDNELSSLHIESIVKSISRASNITGQLLNFSQPKVNTEEITDVNEVVSELENLVAHTMDKKIRLVIELSPVPVLAAIDGSQLQQVLLNLVINARDAVDLVDNAEIKIKTQMGNCPDKSNPLFPEAGECIKIEILDNGHGISKDIIGKVFDPFFSTKGAGKGSGLGLSSSFGIINIYTGTIEVESIVGQGSKFTIFLPVGKAEGSEREGDSAQTLSGNINILIAEDDENISSILVEFLERKGIKTVLAKDGQEALEICQDRADEFDLIIADLNMPRMSGGVFLRKVFLAHPEMKALVATGDSTTPEAVAIGNLANCKLISKPYSLNDLTDFVASLLNA